MSKSAMQILSRVNAGVLPLVDDALSGAIPPNATPLQGLLIDATGGIYAANVALSPVDHYANGLPFDVNGRLVFSFNAGSKYHSQGLTFVNGALSAVATGGAGEYFDQGLKFGAGGAVVTGTAPPPPNLLYDYYPLVRTGLNLVDNTTLATHDRASQQTELWTVGADIRYTQALSDEPGVGDEGLRIRRSDTSYQAYPHDVTQSLNVGGRLAGWRDINSALIRSYDALDPRSNFGMSKVLVDPAAGVSQHRLYGAETIMGVGVIYRAVSLVLYPEGNQQFLRIRNTWQYSNGGNQTIIFDMLNRVVSYAGGSVVGTEVTLLPDGVGAIVAVWVNFGSAASDFEWEYTPLASNDISDDTYLGVAGDGFSFYAAADTRWPTDTLWSPALALDGAGAGSVASTTLAATTFTNPTQDEDVTIYGVFAATEDQADAAGIVVYAGLYDNTVTGYVVALDVANDTILVAALLNGAVVALASSLLLPGPMVAGDYVEYMYTENATEVTWTLKYNGGLENTGVSPVFAPTRLVVPRAVLYNSAQLDPGETKIENVSRNIKRLPGTGYTIAQVASFDENTP